MKEWPNFTWDDRGLSYKLGKVRSLQCKVVGNMSAVGFDIKINVILDALTADSYKVI